MELKYIILLLYTLHFTNLSESKCVMRGVCARANDKDLNCLNNNKTDEPQRVDLSTPGAKEALDGLKGFCPWLFEEEDNPPLCCDLQQIQTTVINSKMSEAFARCPTCMKNILHGPCEMSCSPEQAKFMEPRKTAINEKGEEYVIELNLYAADSYIDGTYHSCRRVSMPSSGGLMLDMMCGPYPASECNAERFFEFLGILNIYTPFPIYYIRNNNSNESLMIEGRSCDQQYTEEDIPCGCIDCAASCNLEKYPKPEEGFMIWVLNGYSAIVAIVLLSLTTTGLVVYLIIYKIKSRPKIPDYNKKTNSHNYPTTKHNTVNNYLETFFRALGIFVARNSILVICLSSWIVIAIGYGALSLKVTTNPVEIWAAPGSRSRMEKDYFDQNFKPFYRTNQIFIKAVDVPEIQHTYYGEVVTLGPAFNRTFLLEVFKLQKEIEKIGLKEGEGLDKICFSPMSNDFTGPITVDKCTIQSVLGLFNNDVDYFKSLNQSVYLDKMIKCAQSAYSVECLAPYGGPIEPGLSLIGTKLDNYRDAIGVGLTFLVNNKINSDELEPMLKWEAKYIKLLNEWQSSEHMDMAYSAERSIEDEIDRVSQSEMLTIIISYAVMFVYIAISLGRFKSFGSLLLDSKLVLGIGGILIVLCSVVCALGFSGYAGIATTLLTIEVIPFLVLAVGVDNIFIIVQTHQRAQYKEMGIEEQIGETMAKVGPSMLLTSLSEILCFAIGAISDMPAVHTFAVYGTLALLFDLILQLTTFVALLAIDERRYKDKRLELLCCIKLKSGKQDDDNTDFFYYFWKHYYTPFIMNFNVRCIIVFLFTLMLSISISVIPTISIGLDQELSMPKDSHVLKYFKYMKNYMGIGPPVYWVTKGELDYSDPDIEAKYCGRGGCLTNSISTQLFSASEQTEISYVARQPSSWLDDFRDWGEAKDCCKYFPQNNSFCPHDNSICTSCQYTSSSKWPEYFNKHLLYFLNDNPDANCAKGGHPSYADGISYYIDDEEKMHVVASYMMSYHKVLRSSEDYYTALESARKISDDLTKTLDVDGVEIFPYSVFYVFFEQYLTIWADALESLGYSLVIIFCVTFLISGFNFFTASTILIVVLMILVNMGGLMYFWSVTLNAVSLVNLVMTVGIGVEFCGHIMHSFQFCEEETALKKAKYAIETMGSSVFSGITLTKFFGIIVLAFAQSQIFQIFYFRMYLGIVVIGALHGLLFLPAFVTLYGQLFYG